MLHAFRSAAHRYGKDALDALIADVRTLGSTRLDGVDEPVAKGEW
jgi:hypothetical protein